MDGHKFARRCSVGWPDWPGADLPVPTPELTRVRRRYCFSLAWGPGSLRIKACTGVVQRWPPETIACHHLLGSSASFWVPRTIRDLLSVAMRGWDYGRSGVGT